MKKIIGHVCSLTIVGIAWLLIIANAPAPQYPPSSYSIHVDKNEGDIPIEIDRRIYVDKPFTITLPAGRYRLFVMKGLSKSSEKAPVETVLLKIEKGDSRLEGDPVRVEFTFKAESNYDRSYRFDSLQDIYFIEVEDVQGRKGKISFVSQEIRGALGD